MTNYPLMASYAHSARMPRRVRIRNTSMLIVALPVLLVLGALTLNGLREWPSTAVLVVDLIFCCYLKALFKSKYSFLFVLHPVVLLASSQLYVTPFLLAGDGVPYAAIVGTYIDSNSLAFYSNNLMGTDNSYESIKSAYFGVAPVFVVPEYVFSNPAAEVYYLWQGTFHVVLCTLVITLARVWQSVSIQYLLPTALFAVVSPTFFELGSAPTRHFVTFIAVYSLFIAYTAMMRKFSTSRIILLVIGGFLLLVSKVSLFIPFFLFVFIDQLLLSQPGRLRRKLIVLGILTLAMVLLGGHLFESYARYKEISETGAATFAAYAQLPLVGAAIKYVYALLSPFPWSEAAHFIANTYAGNWLLFLMHVLSSLMGLYLFFSILIHIRRVFKYDPELTQSLTFGLIMSLSILKGATGFHGYLSMYFPFLAPLLTVKRFRINMMVPIAFVLLIELFILIFK